MGMDIMYSDNNYISGNSVLSNYNGIMCHGANGNLISDNTCENSVNGIGLGHSSNNNIIKSNIITSGTRA